MPRPDTDRNLLLGVLALQMDFLTRDALIAAMNAWAIDKGRGLGEVLEAQGAIAPADLALLHAMVARHVERHGGDPERSLAALRAGEMVAPVLDAIGDAGLQATLTRVASGGSTAAEADATLPHAPLGPDPGGGRFRKLRDHARGNLGVVFVAHDSELNREVALKEIRRDSADDPASRDRFLIEAEVTGGLEHPGIVPVYSLGRYGDGQPFYAMRFIKGDSLKDAISEFHEGGPSKLAPGERSLALRKLVRRFLDVCNAIDYAHSRGILHRDLKPANVMVGRYGETLVVDWGLAKVIGREGRDGARPEGTLRPASASGSSETEAGSIVGTPAYMSPEQAAGEGDRLGPASDVYSLGATLYVLLTGHIPFDSAPIPELLQKVRRGEFPRPSAVAPRAPRPLEAICLKAMALRPEDRYPSARALADDLDRWIADEPVSAYPEPIPARARRWLRNHRTLAASAAVALVVALAGLAVALRRESALNRELKISKGKVDEANGRLVVANRDLASALESAKEARATADRRLDQTLAAIEDYYTGVAGEVLLRNEEFRSLRARLLEKPRRFYEEMARELASAPAGDARSRHLLVKGRFALGQVYQALGRHEDARAQYAANIVPLRELDAAHPDWRPYSYRDDLGENYNNLAAALISLGKFKEARPAILKAIEAREALVAARPDAPAMRYPLLLSEMNLGLIALDEDRLDEAEASFRKAIADGRAIVAAGASSPESDGGLSKAYNNLAVVLGRSGRFDEAIAALREAIATDERIVAAHPEVPDFQLGLAGSYANLGGILFRRGRAAEAKAELEKSVALHEKFVAAQPNVPIYRDGLAKADNILGLALRDTGRIADGEAAIRRGIDVMRPLVATWPRVPAYRESLARSHVILAGLIRDSGRLLESLGPYQEAISTYEALVEEDADRPENRSVLAATFNNRAIALHALGRDEAAVADCRAAIRHQRRAFEGAPRVLQYRQFLSNHYGGLAESLRALGRAEEAAEATREREKLWPGDRNQLYNVACELAQCVPIASEPALKVRLASEAMDALRAAAAAGWRDGVHAEGDPDLAPLRGRSDFRDLVSRLAEGQFPHEPFAH